MLELVRSMYALAPWSKGRISRELVFFVMWNIWPGLVENTSFVVSNGVKLASNRCGYM